MIRTLYIIGLCVLFMLCGISTWTWPEVVDQAPTVLRWGIKGLGTALGVYGLLGFLGGVSMILRRQTL